MTFPAVTAQSIATEPRWSGSVGVLAGHDSNPNLLSEDLLLPIPSPASAANPKLVSGRTGDSVASADLHLRQRPVSLGGGWTLAADLREEGSFHRDLHLSERRADGGGRPSRARRRSGGAVEGPLGWAEVPAGSDKVSVLFQGGLDELRLDNASYLRLFALAGSVTCATSPDGALRFDLYFQDRAYYRQPLADPRRNGQELSGRDPQDLLPGQPGPISDDWRRGVGPQGRQRLRPHAPGRRCRGGPPRRAAMDGPPDGMGEPGELR